MTTIIKRAPITMDGKYKTASGKNVRILCVDAVGTFPVVGMIEGEDGADCWTRDGFFYTPNKDCGYNLVAVPEIRTVWVNVYDDGNGPVATTSFQSEDRARELAFPDAIAVAVPVTFEVRK